MKQDFLIIGAGIIGLATAESLLKQGASVTVLERGRVGQEASWAGGGILSPLCPWDYAEPVTQLAIYSAGLFATWAEKLHAASGIDPEYGVSGMQVLPPFHAPTAQLWCAAHKIRIEMRDDALFLPDVAQVRNPYLLRALRNHVTMLGGRIVEQCAVSDIVAADGRVQRLNTSSGEYRAEHFVVTAGAWSKEVLGQHALKLDLRPMRGQMLLFKFATSPLRHIVLQGDLYLIPRRDGHLLVGSTLEDVGFDKQTTRAARDNLHQRAQKILPQLRDMPLIQQWAGLRPASPHNIPTIARHPQLENLYLNSGHFRYGVTMAPASAAILVNEIMGAAQPLNVAPYRAAWSCC